MDNCFYPEGVLLKSPSNIKTIASQERLRQAVTEETILEARARMCDDSFRLIFDIGGRRGIMEPSESAFTQDGFPPKDIAIITRVAKPVSFVIKEIGTENGEPVYFLSRRRAQELCLDNYLDNLCDGDIVDARVTHFEPFGCFCDIGCGIVSLLGIDCISVSRISHPRDRFFIGEYIRAAVKCRDEILFGKRGRIALTHKELLGTWNENVSLFKAGETVPGIVRSVENYGIFIELAPNLAGLAEYRDGVSPGQTASVFIKSIIPSKHKIKLVIVEIIEDEKPAPHNNYYISEGNISGFDYFS
ncbi:MAG: 30S ribosomal protein S1 [Oscillospiraceae bacterium]|nr:30S ribosomal protein S1 [Oscillospiraceae bacterium]